MINESNSNQVLTREERNKQRKEIIKKQHIENRTLVDIEKEIVEGVGENYVQNLLNAIINKDETEKQKILLQIGCDIHTIMKQKGMPAIEDMGFGEYKIVCLTGTAGQRGLLRINDGSIVLNFPDLDDRQYNSRPSMKEAVESLFNITADSNNNCVINIGQVE